MLILIVGLPGTGKTTLALELAKEIDAVHLNSDMIRTSLGLRGQYDAASKAAVYKELHDKAAEVLKQGKKLIIDATLYKVVLRDSFEKLANKYHVPIKWIELKAEDASIKKRVSKKRQYSEADFEVYLKIKATYQPIGRNHLILRSDILSLEEMIEKAQEYIELSKFSSE